MREETETDRQRRLEETRKQIEAETSAGARADPARGRRPQLLAATKVTGKALDDADHRRLIDEAIAELDFSVLEKND